MRRYLYEVQFNSESPLHKGYNIQEIVDHLNKAIGLDIYSYDILSNYFRKRTKKINKLCLNLKTLKRTQVFSGHKGYAFIDDDPTTKNLVELSPQA
jgi:hypothetical protein